VLLASLDDEALEQWLLHAGRLPLPPYIQREPGVDDRERYQTVFAREIGAVAAPTAGLHFDEALLATLKEKGVEFGHVTLHVGAGTFQPVRVDDLTDHVMHREWLNVGAELVQQVRRTRAAGGRVIGVGTTVVRARSRTPENHTGRSLDQILSATMGMSALSAIRGGTLGRGRPSSRGARRPSAIDAQISVAHADMNLLSRVPWIARGSRAQAEWKRAPGPSAPGRFVHG
jgi:hypothetical protein